MHVINCKSLECSSIGQGHVTLFRILNRFLFRSRSTVKIAASTCSCKQSKLRGRNTNLGVHVIHGQLLESNCISQRHATLFRLLFRFLLSGRSTVKVATSSSGRIGSNDSKLGVHVIDRKPFKCSCIGQCHSAHLSLFNRLLLNGTEAVEVATSSRSTGRNNSKFGMHVIDCKPLESNCISQRHGTLFHILNRLLLSGRNTIKVTTSSSGWIGSNNSKFGMHIIDCKSLECSCIGQGHATLLYLLNRLLRNGRWTVEVATSSSNWIGGNNSNFRMKVLKCSSA